MAGSKSRARAKSRAKTKQKPEEVKEEQKETFAQRRARRKLEKQLRLENDPEYRKKRKRNRIIAGVVAGVIVILLGVLAWLFYIGALAPYWAAAKYDGMNYITEQEVEDYIDSYKVQVGYSDASDEEWAAYLDYCGLTPETLRIAVIQQLVTTEMVIKAADEAGAEISDEEWETYATNIKNNLAFGDDEVYEETIAAQGMTVEEFEENYRLYLLRARLYETVVPMPEADEDDAMDYLTDNYYSGTTTKHIYYFTVSGLDEDGGYEDLQYVQEIYNELVEIGVSVENFELMVAAYCDDDDLVARSGANGWDIDISDYSDNYQEAVENTEVGELSDVFVDDEGYAFIYIDTEYELPSMEEGYEFSDIPETLQEYFIDCAAYVMWEEDCEEYLFSLYENSGVIIYAMPDDVSYNVDMSIIEDDDADSDDESVEEEATEEDDTE